MFNRARLSILEPPRHYAAYVRRNFAALFRRVDETPQGRYVYSAVRIDWEHTTKLRLEYTGPDLGSQLQTEMLVSDEMLIQDPCGGDAMMEALRFRLKDKVDRAAEKQRIELQYASRDYFAEMDAEFNAALGLAQTA